MCYFITIIPFSNMYHVLIKSSMCRLPGFVRTSNMDPEETNEPVRDKTNNLGF